MPKSRGYGGSTGVVSRGMRGGRGGNTAAKNAGFSTKNRLGPVRMKGTLGYRKGQDVATGSGGTAF